MNKLIFTLFASVLLSFPLKADDFQCVSDKGCVALLPSPGGTKEIKFRKGDIISTSSGFIVNPLDGWNRVGCPMSTPYNKNQRCNLRRHCDLYKEN